jgi:microtubule-associated protein-like 6
LREGIGNIAFSNDGKRVAACALDADHTLAVYDIDRAVQSRLNPNKKNSDEGLIATGKLTRVPVFDVRFEPQDKFIVVAALKEILFITLENGVLRKVKGIWEKSNLPQSVLTIGFVESNVVTGMFRG